MIDGFREAIDTIEERKRTLEVHSPARERAGDIAGQFETKNVTVTHTTLPNGDEEGFIIVRDTDGRFLASLGVATFDAILSPEIHPPWVLAETETDLGEVFDFLEDTLFSSFDRTQMLATAREIEERAWRIGVGRLFVGFQQRRALEAQREVYEALANHGQLSVHVFAATEWDINVDGTVHRDVEEIRDFWFVLFDGGGSDLEKAGLLAEERAPGTYYGFWTYDPAIVDDLLSYVEGELLP